MGGERPRIAHERTEVDFDLRDNELVLRRNGGRGAELVERLRGTSKSGMTTQQLLALTRS